MCSVLKYHSLHYASTGWIFFLAMVQRLPVIPFARENQDNILRGLYIDSFMCSTIPELSQNEPNPFSENSVIKYYLPSDTYFAELTISNMEGVSIRPSTLMVKVMDR